MANASTPNRAERIGVRSHDLDGMDTTSIPTPTTPPIDDAEPAAYDTRIHASGNPWSGYWDADGRWIE